MADQSKLDAEVSRKDFLKIGALAGLALVTPGLMGVAVAKEQKNSSPQLQEGDDVLLRLKSDVIRCLQKPESERNWTMVIDLRKCVGCHACTIACKAENATPPGVVYRRVIEVSSGKYPNPKRNFVPILCNHCAEPSCVKACPVTATKKRPDGIVDMDYDKCIGCRACLTACPYGARSADFGEFYTEGTPKLQAYEKRPTYEYGQKRVREKGKSPIGNARKCHFCIHRIEAKTLPACVSTCIGKATFFGDAKDSQSLVFQMIKKEKVTRLKAELGQEPNVYYIGMEGVEI